MEFKNGEGDRLMAKFKAEMDRLTAPPDWRAIWGIATLGGFFTVLHSPA